VTSGERTEQRTILFADVCESTAIYESVGDTAALALLNFLFERLDKEVKAAGGVIVKNLGDGLVCQFSDADAAFRAACKMQEASAEVAAAAWPAMKIKVGYNYGPVVLKGGDVFGDTVNVCARLVSLANPAQVLTTLRTVEMLSPGFRGRCRELYVTPVRGRVSQVRVWEVLWRSDPDVTKVEVFEPSGEPGARWVLKVTLGGESHVVQPGSVLRIGRDAGNDVVVGTEHASRIHARIFTREDHFVIVDQSSNGTFLMADGSREVRLRRSEALLGDRGWIGLGRSAATHGDHVLRYRLERDPRSVQ
jgi:class 3 adenylate cyclase